MRRVASLTLSAIFSDKVFSPVEARALVVILGWISGNAEPQRLFRNCALRRCAVVPAPTLMIASSSAARWPRTSDGLVGCIKEFS